MDADNRFESLETKAAYQEETLSKLNGEVWDLARRMDRMEALISELRRKLGDLERPDSGAPADQRPPHY